MEKQLRELIKEAMKNKDKVKQTVYKSILEKAQKAAKDKKEDVNDSYIYNAIKTELKQQEDLLQYCKEGTDKYAEVITCIEICKTLQPAMVDAETIMEYLVSNSIEKNMGVCMKSLKAKYKDSLDGRAAQGVVKNYISS